MGNNNSSESDARQREEVSEFLDEHPDFLGEYIDRNPHLLDDYVHNNVDEFTVREWLKKVEAPPPSEILQCLRIDYLKQKNCAQHHTDKYEHNSLVVRRASTFELDIYFKNRAFVRARDDIVLEFSIGEKPSVSNGSMFRVPVGDLIQGSKWSCMLMGVDDEKKKITVQVHLPSDAIVGRYKLTVEVTTRLADGPKAERKVKPDVIVLFNPFAPEDDVYMEDEAKRNEYVMSDTGILYYGQYYRWGGMDWLFGQFETGILDIALKLLREEPNAKKNPVKSMKKRSSPVYCSRTLSAMVNSNDRSGVLFGRWDGEYDDGKSPTSWNGSVKILKQWNDEKMAAVRYGQCWVFSGVLVTVLRAIGIPSRSITNFQSAHDTEFNMTIDRFVDEDGEESDLMSTGDSIWNFHVWNEGWFLRPDLPKGYEGWQAVDATPQEESSGVYQCGPAPVKAVKKGEIFIGYDTNFLFGEVNADRLTWKVDKTGEVTGLVRRETRHIGRNISTKAVGSDEREDVTLEYKYPEASTEEREAFDRAYAFGRKAPYHDKFDVIEEEGAITIDIAAIGEAINGKTVAISVKVKNTTEVKKSCRIISALNTMLHNDERKTLLKRAQLEVELDGGAENEQKFEVPFADYGRHLVDNNVIRVFTTVRVKETDNLYVDSFDVQITSPKCLSIEMDDKPKRMKSTEVTFTIVNPLPVTLTGGVFTLDGSGLIGDNVVKTTEPIEPNATYTTKPISVRLYRGGKATMVADFDCKEIYNIKARKKIEVVVD